VKTQEGQMRGQSGRVGVLGKGQGEEVGGKKGRPKAQERGKGGKWQPRKLSSGAKNANGRM